MLDSHVTRASVTFCLFLLSISTVHAQAGRSDIMLTVDASDAPRKILHARETIFPEKGPLTLYYPKWIPGEHGPTGPVTDFVGLKISVDGLAVLWNRDPEDMYAIHCNVPTAAKPLELSFDFVLPSGTEGFSAAASSSAQLLVLSWNQVVLYPKDVRPDKITVSARMRIPDRWKFGTALDVEAESSREIRFKVVSLETLIDSPVLMGRYFKRLDISSGTGTPHFIDMASDGEEALQMPERIVDAYERLVRETNTLFGAHHYSRYDFLYTLSNSVAHFGLEHHQSSDNRVAERTLLDDDLRRVSASLLPHEFTHSWNGKYRRPADLATGDYSMPMRGDLLWVYEGLTQYLGYLLAARSGLRSPEEYREHLALTAAELDNRPGREWRPLQDAATAAQILYGAPYEWDSYRRSVDFYDEGNLLWLEADAIIRQQTDGRKSLDDFCKLFHGGQTTGPTVNPYTFDDVVVALNAVVPYDWQGFLTDRLQSLNSRAPLGGIERSGWKLVYRDTVGLMVHTYEEVDEHIDMRFSLGIMFDEDGQMLDVIPNAPAGKAGLGPGMKLIAINGRKFTKEIVRDAVKSTKERTAPLEFLVQNADYFTTYAIEYYGGERYPFLERDPSKPDILSAIIRPLTSDAR